MKIDKNNIRKLIRESISKQVSAAGTTPIPYYYLTGGCSDRNLRNTAPEFKSFAELVGYVCAFEILENPNPNVSRRYIQINSGWRSGARQLQAWCSKILSGESRDNTVDQYSPRNRFGDPFMTEETYKSAAYAYDTLVTKLKEHASANNIDFLDAVKSVRDNLRSQSDQRPKNPITDEIAAFLDKNPCSSHMAGQSIDFRVIQGRRRTLLKTFELIKKQGLADFHFQLETQPPHYHMGPLQPYGQPAIILTEKGRGRLDVYRVMANQAIKDFPGSEVMSGRNIVNPVGHKLTDKLWSIANRMGIYENEEK